MPELPRHPHTNTQKLLPHMLDPMDTRAGRVLPVDYAVGEEQQYNEPADPAQHRSSVPFLSHHRAGTYRLRAVARAVPASAKYRRVSHARHWYHQTLYAYLTPNRQFFR